MRIIFGILALSILAACAGGGGEPLTAEKVQAVAFRANETPRLTLLTTVNNRNGQGAHTALLVSGSQRVLFDPAGSFRSEDVFRHNDLMYGVTDRKLQTFRSFQASSRHRVVSQTIPVSAASAERALQLVQARGSVAPAYCANSTAEILQQLPETADVKVTFYPVQLMDQIKAKPGITTSVYYENDAGEVLDGPEGLTQ